MSYCYYVVLDLVVYDVLDLEVCVLGYDVLDLVVFGAWDLVVYGA